MAPPEVKTEPKKLPDSGREPIAIKSLTFRSPGVTLPGGLTVSSLMTGEKVSRQSYVIELLPWLRQYRVTRLEEKTRRNAKNEAEQYFEPGGQFLVHESWAVAELAE
jgi:hypothetical protein